MEVIGVENFVKKKKKINYVALAKMYHDLGTYRIVEHCGRYVVQRYSYSTWVTQDMTMYKNTSIDELKQMILNTRYSMCKLKRSYTLRQKQIKNPKVLYQHP